MTTSANPPISEVLAQTAKELGCPISEYLHPDLEFQVNPFPDEDRYERFGTYVDTGFVIRIPENADTEPVNNDGPMPFHPRYIRRIGTTGWDWRKRQSLIFAFDADAIIGHKKEGLPEDEMQRLLAAASKLPYVQINRSTSGNGYHLWVLLREAVKTMNHAEHGALGKAILRQMSQEAEYDFDSKIDAKATNTWIAARDKGEHGFEIVKSITEPLAKIPEWSMPAPVEIEGNAMLRRSCSTASVRLFR